MPWVVWDLLSSVWKSVDFCIIVWMCSFGLERLDTWFRTFSCVWFGFGSSQTHFLLGLS